MSDKFIKQVQIELELLIDEFEDLATITKQGLDKFDSFESKWTLFNLEEISERLTYNIGKVKVLIDISTMLYKAKEEQKYGK